MGQVRSAATLKATTLLTTSPVTARRETPFVLTTMCVWYGAAHLVTLSPAVKWSQLLVYRPVVFLTVIVRVDSLVNLGRRKKRLTPVLVWPLVQPAPWKHPMEV
jgi:hypothetical protein